MEVDLVITGGTVVTTSGRDHLGIAIDGGQIVALARDEALPAAREYIDATGLHVLPGIIDPHVHVRDPGKIEREDFRTATAAAAAGGITTIFEMPIAMPPVNSAQNLRDRIEVVQPKALVDFAFYGGAAGDNLDHIEAMAEAGVIAFKTFRTAPPAGREKEFIGLSCPDPGDFLRALERVAATGRVAAVHAEEEQILRRIAKDMQAAGDSGPLSHARSRPSVVEEASVAQSLALARAAGARIHFVHCSSPYSLDLIRHARAEGLQATAETCPPYLFLTEADLERHGPFAKTNPPLRPADVVEVMWERVTRGDVDVIGTDHSPFLIEEKEPYWQDMWQAAPGGPGLEVLVPLLLTAVNQGRITLERMLALTSEHPARIFGLYPRKGTIRVGSDGDLVLADLKREGKIDTRTWHSKSKGTARVWEGLPTRGAVVATLVRGKVVARENQIIAEPGWGQFVAPYTEAQTGPHSGGAEQE